MFCQGFQKSRFSPLKKGICSAAFDDIKGTKNCCSSAVFTDVTFDNYFCDGQLFDSFPSRL